MANHLNALGVILVALAMIFLMVLVAAIALFCSILLMEMVWSLRDRIARVIEKRKK